MPRGAVLKYKQLLKQFECLHTLPLSLFSFGVSWALDPLYLTSYRIIDKDFGISSDRELTRAKEALLYNELLENEKQRVLFTDGSCCTMGKCQRWKAAAGNLL